MEIQKKSVNHPYSVSKKVEIIYAVVILILAFLLFPTSVSADSVDIYAESHSTGSGDYVFTSSQSLVSDTESSASAEGRSISSDGRTATVEVEAYSVFMDESSGISTSYASASSHMGETVWAEAKVYVYSSKNGGISISESSYGIFPGDGRYIDSGNGNNDNPRNNLGNHENGGNTGGKDTNTGDENSGGSVQTKKPHVVQIKQTEESMFGYSFGKSDPERYYCFKMAAENITGPCIDGNNTNYSQARAKYNIGIILNDYGMNKSQFEDKYKKEMYPVMQGVSDISRSWVYPMSK